MKVEKRVGPSTEPWGTPEVGKPEVEKESRTRVSAHMFDHYSCIAGI